jgi:hypothetical protein
VTARLDGRLHAEHLRRQHVVSTTIIASDVIDGIALVVVRATDKFGRFEDEIGSVVFRGARSIQEATDQAKERATAVLLDLEGAPARTYELSKQEKHELFEALSLGLRGCETARDLAQFYRNEVEPELVTLGEDSFERLRGLANELRVKFRQAPAQDQDPGPVAPVPDDRPTPPTDEELDALRDQLAEKLRACTSLNGLAQTWTREVFMHRRALKKKRSDALQWVSDEVHKRLVAEDTAARKAKEEKP